MILHNYSRYEIGFGINADSIKLKDRNLIDKEMGNKIFLINGPNYCTFGSLGHGLYEAQSELIFENLLKYQINKYKLCRRKIINIRVTSTFVYGTKTMESFQ